MGDLRFIRYLDFANPLEKEKKGEKKGEKNSKKKKSF